MKIENLTVKNVTVFKDIVIKLVSGVNVLVGENGTGKTHLLKMLYSFCQSADSREQKYYDNGMAIILGRYLHPIGNMHGNSLISVNDIVVYEEGKLNEYGELMGYELDSGVDQAHPRVNPVFIPAKEVLSMSNLTRINNKYSRELGVDKTIIDIIESARSLKPDVLPELARILTPRLECFVNGKVYVQESDGTFWIQKHDGTLISFSMEAEGICKLGLFWQLLMNESITKDSILFWDEPDSNINPAYIPAIVEDLLELSRHGVQVFVATHDYVLAKYFEVRAKENDSVMFHSLYKTADGVKCESCKNFRDLKNNPIISPLGKLMDEVINGNLGD